MATETVALADRIQKTFDDLDSETNLISACCRQWKNISDHFASLSKTLDSISQTLDSNIHILDSRTQQTLASLDARETEIPNRESEMSISIESKKESAVKEMEDPGAKTPSSKGEFLRLYCRRMDHGNLWRYMILHRKDLVVLRKEIMDAINESVDCCRLVIDAVDDFLNEGGSIESGGDRCWAIGMLLRALFDSEGRKGPDVSMKIKERAMEVAVEWKKRIGVKGDGAGEGEREREGGEMGGAEAQIFLQMVAAFGLSSRFEEEELGKLVLEHASRKEMAKLAVGLGLKEKMEDIIDELVKTGKELEAVCFACESGLTDKYPPTPLLKNYLHASRKKAALLAKNGNNPAAATEESTNGELAAIRAIIKCVEYYKLESKFGIEGLRKRLSVLEKAKSDRKKTAATTKFQAKRARATAGPSYRPPKAVRMAREAYAASFQPPPARHPYNYSLQGGGYDSGSAPAPYGTGHARGHGFGGYDYGASNNAPAQTRYPH